MKNNVNLLRMYRVLCVLMMLGVVTFSLHIQELKERITELENKGRYPLEVIENSTETEIESKLRERGIDVDAYTVDLEHVLNLDLRITHDENFSFEVLNDLSRAARLISLDISGASVSDLRPLQSFSLYDVRLESLDVSESDVVDLSPLADHPIRRLHISNTKISSLATLAVFPLKYLDMNHLEVSDLSPLKGKQIDTLKINFCPVSDISPLSGMPLEELEAAGTVISDLTPLQGTPLRMLSLHQTQVKDLTPLKGMELYGLGLANTQVDDLTPLAGMHLSALNILDTGVRDLTPLEGMNLEMLAFEPWKIVRGIETIRAMSNLNIISVGNGEEYTYFNPTDFWSAYDRGDFNDGPKKWKSRNELIPAIVEELESNENYSRQ